MTSGSTKLVTVWALVCLSVAGANAQTGRGAHPPAQPPAPADDTPVFAPGEVINMLDAYAVMQAQTALQLADDQYGEFVTRLRRLQQTRRRYQQERTRLIQELRRLTNPQVKVVDEAAVRDQLGRLRELDVRATGEQRRAYDALDEMLNPRQQARFRIFEEMLERRKLDLLMRARRSASGGQGR